MNQAKLAIPSKSESLQWEQIGKVVNQVRLAVPSHSEPLQWEKIGKVVIWVKVATLTTEPCNLEPKNPPPPEAAETTKEPEDNTEDYEQLKE